MDRRRYILEPEPEFSPPIKVKGPKPKKTSQEAPLKRKRLARSFSYRGVHFMIVPNDGLTKVYTLGETSKEPSYQCTVPAEHVKYAVFALARIALAEMDLQAVVHSVRKRQEPGIAPKEL